MFTELLQAEIWRKRLEEAGYRVVPEKWQPGAAEAAPREAAARRPTPALALSKA